MRKFLLFIALSLAAFSAPARAGDISLVQLNVSPYHAGSKIWNGKFTGLNGRAYNAAHFYRTESPQFSASAIWSKSAGPRLTYLLPVAFDAGYEATLMQTRPLLGIGLGAAMAFGEGTMLSVRLENILRLGGQTSEQPCRDEYRRRFHCGSGMAWTDYEKSPADRRGQLGVAGFQARLIHRFSF